jgi:hypothetical protein
VRLSFQLLDAISKTLLSIMGATLLTVILLWVTFPKPGSDARATELAFAAITVACLVACITIDAYIDAYSTTIPARMSLEGIGKLTTLGVMLHNTRFSRKCVVTPPKGSFLAYCPDKWRYVICDSKGDISAVIVCINGTYQAISCADCRTVLSNVIDSYLCVNTGLVYAVWLVTFPSPNHSSLTELRLQIASKMVDELLVSLCTDVLIERFAPAQGSD